MRRLLTMLVILGTVTGMLYAEYQKDPVRAVMKSGVIKTVTAPETAEAVAEPAVRHEVRPAPFRINPDKIRVESSKVNNLMLTKYDRSADRTFSKSGDLMMDVNGSDTAYYAVGDLITFSVMTEGMVELEFFLDDGDGVFDDYSDFLMSDPEHPITITDNDEMDMNPAVGIWTMIFSTTEMMEGPFFGIEDVAIYIRGYDINLMTEGLVVLYSEPMMSDQVIEGGVLVDLGSGMTAPADILVLAMAVDSMGMGPDGMPMAAYGAFTDSEGSYSMHVDPAYAATNFMIVPVDVFGYYPGYFPEPGMASGMPNSGSVDFLLTMGNVTIEGYLTDANGNGIPGVSVHIGDDFMDLNEVTDFSGYYSFTVNEGYYWVDFDPYTLRGDYMVPYGYEADTYNNPDSVYMTYTYAVDGTISGNVRNSSGTGLEGLEVYGSSWDEMNGFFTISNTDVNGDYTLYTSSMLDPDSTCDEWGCYYFGGYWVEVWDPMMEGYFEYMVEPPYATGQTGVDLVLVSTDVRLFGYVYDAETNAPLYDAEVWAHTPFDSGMTKGTGYYDNVTWTNEQGYYEMGLVGGNEYDIEVFYPGFGQYPMSVERRYLEAGDHEFNYYISKPVTKGNIGGMVYDKEMMPLAGVQVEINGWTWDGSQFTRVTNTKTDGSFEFRDVPFGGYDFYAYPPDGANPVYKWVDLNNMNPNPYVEIVFGRDDKIGLTGVVTDPQGFPIAGAMLQAYDWYNGMGFMTFSDENGYYEFFVPEGDYDVSAGFTNYYKSGTWIYVSGATVLDFTLDPIEGGLITISGYVRDSSLDEWDGVAGALVIYETWNYVNYHWTDNNGYYAVSIVPNEDYDIYVSHPDFYEFYNWQYFSEDGGYDMDLWPINYNFGFEIVGLYDRPDDHGGAMWVDWEPFTGTNCGVESYLVTWKPIFDTVWKTPVKVTPDVVSEEQYLYHFLAQLGTNTDYDFQVITLGYCGGIYRSNIVSGRPIDNLPPMVPDGVQGSAGEGSISLSWDSINIEPIMYYSISRKFEGGVYEHLANTTATEYIDETEDMEGEVHYQIMASDFSGNMSEPAEVMVYMEPTGIEGGVLPTVYALKQNYPNPFNPTTTISFDLPERSAVTLTVYDALGNTVTTLVSADLEAGTYSRVWNGKDRSGRQVSSGLYFYKLTAADHVMINKMVLLR